MIRDYQTKKISIRLNTPLRGYVEGQTVRIKVDANGTPTERYWRDRFNDAKKDGCVEVLETKTTAKKKKED